MSLYTGGKFYYWGDFFWVKSNGLYCTCPFPCTKKYQDIAEKYQEITGETSHLMKKYQEIRGETTHLLYRGSFLIQVGLV